MTTDRHDERPAHVHEGQAAGPAERPRPVPPGAAESRATALGVLGGSGGVGASVLAAAVAVRAAAARRRVVAVDGDRLGGGLDVVFGVEQEPGLRWPDLAAVRGRVAGGSLLARLPGAGQAAVLSFDRSRDVELGPEVVADVVSGLREAVDLVVVDLPRPTDVLFAAFASRLDAAVLLCGNGVRPLAAASVTAPLLLQQCPEAWLCLQGNPRESFGDSVAEALDLPLVAWVRRDRTLESDLLHGIPPGSSSRSVLARTADVVLAQALLPHSRVAS